MISVVTFKWSTPGYRATFEARHVNVLAAMVARHYQRPHRFVCFTDDPTGLASNVEALPIWDDLAAVPNPTGGGRPSCYRRLKLWSPGMRGVLGERFVCLDLDAVVVGDLAPLWDRTEDVVMWRAPRVRWPYNGAMFMADTGARPHVWTEFDAAASPRRTAAAGYRGSDQAWMSLALGAGEATWDEADGVWFYGAMPKPRDRLPAGARIVFTTASTPPWTLTHQWVREHWR